MWLPFPFFPALVLQKWQFPLLLRFFFLKKNLFNRKNEYYCVIMIICEPGSVNSLPAFLPFSTILFCMYKGKGIFPQWKGIETLKKMKSRNSENMIHKYCNDIMWFNPMEWGWQLQEERQEMYLLYGYNQESQNFVAHTSAFHALLWFFPKIHRKKDWRKVG